jgi:hypothetical protein
VARPFAAPFYSAWDDLESPIIRISADTAMARMIVRAHVRRTEPDDAGGRRERDGRWARVADVSTFE